MDVRMKFGDSGSPFLRYASRSLCDGRRMAMATTADGGHDIRQMRHSAFGINKKPTNWLSQAWETAFSAVFRDNCRPEEADDVISGVVVDCVGMDARAKFGDSRLNFSRIIRLFACGTRFTHFYVLFNCIFQPTGSS